MAPGEAGGGHTAPRRMGKQFGLAVRRDERD